MKCEAPAWWWWWWWWSHGSYLHLHIESPPTWHLKTTQLFRDSGVEQRQVWIQKGETGVWELGESLAGGSQSELGFWIFNDWIRNFWTNFIERCIPTDWILPNHLIRGATDELVRILSHFHEGKTPDVPLRSAFVSHGSFSMAESLKWDDRSADRKIVGTQVGTVVGERLIKFFT